MSRNDQAGVARAILWDLDGVLVRTEDLYFRATEEVLRDFDVILHRSDYHRLFLQESRDPLRLAVAARNLGEDVFQDLHHKRSRKYRGLLGSEEITVEGASETIHSLVGSYTMGVVTGSKREHVDVLKERTDFFHLFDFVITLDDVPATKPHPDPYLRGIGLSGLDAGQCLAIEDSEHGLRSAKSAGLACWIIPNVMTRAADFTSADRILGEIREIPELLRESAA